MTAQATIKIEVACALPDKQRIVCLDVESGCTARAAVEQSNIQEDFPGLDIANCQLGVFGLVVEDSQRLSSGDRVEVYRPLINNPRDSRRALAARGATMGGAKGSSGKS
jgi:putative ubiquitin-RnfH superfamily antitoxin RatB of RatAB toxin-antitoxin module